MRRSPSTLAEKYWEVLDHLRQLPKTRETALAITNLEQSAMWAACGVDLIGSPIDALVDQETDACPDTPRSG